MIWLRYERIVRDAACNFMDYPLDFLVFFYWLDSAWVVISSSGSRKTSCERWSEYGWLAQLAEHLTLNQGVQGSSPWSSTRDLRGIGGFSFVRSLKFQLFEADLIHFSDENCIDRTRFFWVRNGDFGYVCRMQIYLYPHVTAIRSRIPWVLFKIPCTPYLMAWCSLSPSSGVVSPKLFQEASSFLHPAPCQSNSWNK